MGIDARIVGANGRAAEVTKQGQLVTAPLEYSDGKFNGMVVINTAYNFHEPRAGKRLVVTGFIISTSRNVGVNGANIILYEASAADTLTVDKTILQIDMPKSVILPVSGTNFLLTEGAFLNGKTDDAEVSVTIGGYEIDA